VKLHITNGDCTGEMLKEAKDLAGDVLCWRDLLHDGPVLADPQENRQARITYLSEFVVRTSPEITEPNKLIEQDFQQRDWLLSRLDDYDEVVLWFEHDLYDQLQLLEVCVNLQPHFETLQQLSIICIDAHPDVPFFHGLGNLTPQMLLDLFPQRQPLSKAQLDQCADIWSAFTAATPEALAHLANNPIAGWPYMEKALRRFCCEYPALETGLTLTQTYLLLTLLKAPEELPALESHLKLLEQHGKLPEGVTAQSRYYKILSGPANFTRIFHHLQHLEVDPFMGDLFIKHELNRLIQAPVPYVHLSQSDEGEAVYLLTVAGAEALQGLRHWLQDNHYDLWRGGVQITDENVWLWDQTHHCFCQKG